MKKGEKYQVFDEDGHVYVLLAWTFLSLLLNLHRNTDLVGELTAALYGHFHPLIQESIISTIKNVGLNLGATITKEAVHA